MIRVRPGINIKKLMWNWNTVFFLKTLLNVAFGFITKCTQYIAIWLKLGIKGNPRFFSFPTVNHYWLTSLYQAVIRLKYLILPL